MLTTDRQLLKVQLIEAVSQLCTNALQFESELTVEGLIGITLDHRDVLLVNINETFTPPVDISASLDTKFPDISNADALSTDLEEYIAHNTGNAASPSKRKRCGKRPKDGVRATTTQMRPPSLRIAKRKSSSSQSRQVPPVAHTGVESGSCLEADVRPQRSETCPADADIAEYPETLCSLHRNVKMENAESIMNVNSDVETDSQCQRDDSTNTTRYLSPNCRQSIAAVTAVVAAAVDDVGLLSEASDQQYISDSNDHSNMDDSSQLVISNVYSVKEETLSDDGSERSSTLHCGLRADSSLPGQTRVSRTPDSVTLMDQSSPLQVSQPKLINFRILLSPIACDITISLGPALY